MKYYILSQVPLTPEQVHRALTTQDYTTIGVLIVGFCVAILGIWKLSSWTGKELVIPFRDKIFVLLTEWSTKFFSHLDTVGNTLQGICDNLSKLTDVPERLDRMEKKVDTLDRNVEKINNHLTLQDGKFQTKNDNH